MMPYMDHMGVVERISFPGFGRDTARDTPMRFSPGDDSFPEFNRPK